ncbi:MAG: Hpt domain-containing protein [Pseudomonadales bacterium]|nr:Hpt domain-containing protein [Pseudomonadales bacterium]
MPDSDEAFEEEIIEIFVEEVTEVLEIIDDNLLLWEKNQVVDKPLKELRRAFHTLKGSGRMVKANAIGELGWAVENLLNRIIEGGLTARPEMVVLMRDVRSAVPPLLDAFKNRQAAAVSGINVEHYMERSKALVEGRAVVAAQAPIAAVSTPAAPIDNVRPDPAKRNEEISELQEVKDVQKGLVEAVASANLDMANFSVKLDALTLELRQLTTAAHQNNGANELTEKLQQLDQLRSEVGDMQYFVNANSKQVAADNQSQQKQSSDVQQALTEMASQRELLLAQLRKEIKVWSLGAAAAAVVIALVYSIFIA